MNPVGSHKWKFWKIEIRVGGYAFRKIRNVGFFFARAFWILIQYPNSISKWVVAAPVAGMCAHAYFFVRLISEMSGIFLTFSRLESAQKIAQNRSHMHQTCSIMDGDVSCHKWSQLMHTWDSGTLSGCYYPAHTQISRFFWILAGSGDFWAQISRK